ncbi:MAG: hypothetical protein WBE26_15270 [Phycisphaerae bacterium]
MAGDTNDERAARGHSPNRVLVIALAMLTLIGVGVTSWYALITVLLDGVAALIVVLPAILGGLWLVPLFRLGMMPLRWHLLLGAALGLGVASLVILLLGLAGFLQRNLWIIVLSASAIAGVIRLWMLLTRVDTTHRQSRHETDQANPGAWRHLWLLACPFMILALLAASTAPGLIWQEEGFGYDVLEYHLQLPKEYVQAGRIEYAPHNVYANFPANVEMLYLLAMIVLDDVHDVGVVANMIHLIFAVLTVFAAWVAGREWSPQAGIMCGVVTATAGWLGYLCGLAYVENGMLFFGMTAMAILLRAMRTNVDDQRGATASDSRRAAGHWRWIALAGVAVGFACGCKYTAIPLIAVPLTLATFLLPGRSIQRRITGALIFTAAATMTLAPWLIKNHVMTGNPVFPLVNTVFRASPAGWGEDETARWDRGHHVSPRERAGSVRLAAFWNHVLWDKHQRFGPIVLVLAIVGLLGRRRDRVDLLLLTVLIVQLGIWLFATHLFARFAVVLLIPLPLLCGRALIGADSAARRRLIVAALVVGCTWNIAFAARLHRQEGAHGVPASLIYDGRLAGYEYFAIVNHDLPPDAKILLVGDAKAFYFQRDVDYCVAFNRNPFFEAVLAAETEQEVLNWLHEHGYTHVLINWSEVRRLDDTYGFSPPVEPTGLEALFDRLSATGLHLLREFPHPRTGSQYIELYGVE